MSDEERAKDLEYLLERGLTQEAAENFLKDKVSYQTMQLDSRYLREILTEAEKHGVLFGPVTVGIIVPQQGLLAFQKGLEAVQAKHGGFVMTKAEHSALSSLKTEAMN